MPLNLMNVHSEPPRVGTAMLIVIDLPLEQFSATCEYGVVADVREMVLKIRNTVESVVAVTARQVG